MTRFLLYFLPGAGHLAAPLAQELGADIGEIEFHKFPDGETYLRFLTPPDGRHIALVDCLDRPDPKLIPLLFAAMTAKDLGAKSVGLIAPYMPYFRQDIAFHRGESISARHIGSLLSTHLSWVTTLDPHLHRLAGLDDVFTIPGELAHATAPIAQWINTHIESPIIYGPDEESEQWVKSIAEACGAPYDVFRKTRLGDRNVQIEVPPGMAASDHTPVIIDDIISSGTTLATLVRTLCESGQPRPICCAVHGIFAEDAYEQLIAAGAARVVTTNALPHKTNAIDVTGALADAARRIALPED
ncbi:ribose-phosphate diphosphokinase [Hyphomonas sp.]|uniref:ribose-phosphate diphosphokinase n=1 Tax=Hyphomonas sp. TaxID=87 RepID=UPI0035273B04